MKNHSFHPGRPSSLETKTHPVSQRQCDRQNNAPYPLQKHDHILLHRSCADVTLPGQRDFTDVVKDPETEDYSGLSRWVQCKYRGPYKGKKEAADSESEKEV